jgi:hypothetical protein
MKTQVERSQTETYKIFIENRWWATIMIEECSGLLAIQSEYGHFSHYWGTAGRAKGNTFKQELLRFGVDYVQNKLSYNDNLGRYFNFDKTIERIKHDIIERRREHYITKEDARLYWEEMLEIEDCDTTDEFGHQIFSKDELCGGFYSNDYHAIPTVTEDHPRLVKFMKEIYPIFKAELLKEVTCMETA